MVQPHIRPSFQNFKGENLMFDNLKAILISWLLPEFSERLTAAESAVATLKDFQRQHHVRIVQLESAPNHLPRVEALERQLRPVRYVQTPTGLAEVR
jgi:hypothetical protein